MTLSHLQAKSNTSATAWAMAKAAGARLPSATPEMPAQESQHPLPIQFDAKRPSDIAIAFLKSWDSTGRHNLVSIVPDGPVEGRTFAAGDWSGMMAWLDARIATANLYFSINEPAADAPQQKLAKRHIGRLRSISVDIDPGTGELVAAREAILRRVKDTIPSVLPTPSFVIDSGAGFHLHWQLAQHAPADTQREWAESQSRAFSKLLGGDHTHNIDRILRLPGTRNLPDAKKRAAGRVPSPTKLVHQSEARFSPETLSAVAPLEYEDRRDIVDEGALRSQIDEVQDALRRSGYDEAIDSSGLPIELRVRFEAALKSSPPLERVWRGELDGTDQSGSAFRAKLAAILAHIGGFDAEGFARLCYVWPFAVQSHHDRDDRLTPRALARDWCNIAERIIADKSARYEPVLGDGGAKVRARAGGLFGGPDGVGTLGPTLLPTPYRFPPPTSIPPREWIYGTHLIRRFISATVAPGGLGKSSLTIVEAMAMATGKPLLGVKPRGQFRVWLWNGEDPADELERRISATMQHYGLTSADFGDRLFVDSGRQHPITIARQAKDGAAINAPVRAALLSGLIERRIDALYLDPFISSHKVIENDNNAIDIVAKEWAALADEANIAIELVHHVRKTNGAEVTVEDARGAGALVNATRSSRALNRMTIDEAKKLGIAEGEHRRYFRFGGDPKLNLAPAPVTVDTDWFAFRSVRLGNGSEAYPAGDEIGVVEPFVPVRSPEQVRAQTAGTELAVIANAVLGAMGDATEVELKQILLAVIGAVKSAGLTKSSVPHVTRDKVVANLATRGGAIVEHEGQLVRLEAIKAIAGDYTPWTIRRSEVSDTDGASRTKSEVLA